MGAAKFYIYIGYAYFLIFFKNFILIFFFFFFFFGGGGGGGGVGVSGDWKINVFWSMEILEVFLLSIRKSIIYFGHAYNQLFLGVLMVPFWMKTKRKQQINQFT